MFVDEGAGNDCPFKEASGDEEITIPSYNPFHLTLPIKESLMCNRGTLLFPSKGAYPLAIPLLTLSSFKFKAVCVAVDMGLFKSLVLSTLDNPTSDLFKFISPTPSRD